MHSSASSWGGGRGEKQKGEEEDPTTRRRDHLHPAALNTFAGRMLAIRENRGRLEGGRGGGIGLAWFAAKATALPLGSSPRCDDEELERRGCLPATCCCWTEPSPIHLSHSHYFSCQMARPTISNTAHSIQLPVVCVCLCVLIPTCQVTDGDEDGI